VDDWLATVRNYGTYSNETGYYEVLAYLKQRKWRR
jgi:hypothetical protein